ncbi:IS4 family transposase, partial [Pseudomonas syringae pv. actinidiae]|nr:IS4 family transposase [Pseudomonas syringae pv. actinidiae]
MVLWLVVGMALFRGEPIVEVARRLNICADGLANEVLWRRAAFHRRVSAWDNQPVSWLFRQ